jgi:hypothetical protein
MELPGIVCWAADYEIVDHRAEKHDTDLRQDSVLRYRRIEEDG